MSKALKTMHMTLCRLDDVVAFKQTRMATQRRGGKTTPKTIDEHMSSECELVTPRLIYGKGPALPFATLDLRGCRFAALVDSAEPSIGGCLYPSPMLTAIGTDPKDAKITKPIQAMHELLKTKASPSVPVLVRECVPEKVYTNALLADAKVVPKALWPESATENVYRPARAFAVPVTVLLDNSPPLELHLCGYIETTLDENSSSIAEVSKDGTVGHLGIRLLTAVTPKVASEAAACIRSRLKSEEDYVNELRKRDCDTPSKRRKLAPECETLEKEVARLHAELKRSEEACRAEQQRSKELADVHAQERKSTATLLSDLLNQTAAFASSSKLGAAKPKLEQARVPVDLQFVPASCQSIVDSCAATREETKRKTDAVDAKLKESEARVAAYKMNLALVDKRWKAVDESRGDASPRTHDPASVAAIVIPGDDDSTRIIKALMHRANSHDESHRLDARQDIDKTAPTNGYGDLAKILRDEIVGQMKNGMDKIVEVLKKQQAAAVAAAAATSLSAHGAPRAPAVDATSMSNAFAPPARPFVHAGRANGPRR